jgi:4-carboxymuconolactone decarboxylase
MEELTSAQRELVALGAALGSNCVPCIEYHVPQARKAGLSDRQIYEALRLADKLRQVPARKVLDTALELLADPASTTAAEPVAAAQSATANETAPGVAQPKHEDGLKDPRSAGSDKPCCG